MTYNGAAITAADSRIAAAARRFTMKGEGDDMSLCPQNLYARQIRSRWRRRQIEAKLRERL